MYSTEQEENSLGMLTSESRNKQVFSQDIFPALDRVDSEMQRHSIACDK